MSNYMSVDIGTLPKFITVFMLTHRAEYDKEYIERKEQLYGLFPAT